MGNLLCDGQSDLQDPHDLLTQIFTGLKSFQNIGLLKQTIFQEIQDSYTKKYYNPQQKLSLTKVILDYLQKCKSDNLQSRPQSSFFEQMGKKVGEIEKDILKQNSKILQIVSYLSDSESIKLPKGIQRQHGCYLKLKFDMNTEEVLAVARMTRYLYCLDTRSFFFLSFYLWHSSHNLQSTKNVAQINTMLQQAIQVIKQNCPPVPQITDEKQIQLANSFIGQPNKQYCPPSFSFKQIKLISTRQDYLNDYIVKKAEQAAKSKPKFQELIEKICKEKGSELKIDIKVKDRAKKLAIQRVIEKILKPEQKKSIEPQAQNNNKPEQKKSIEPQAQNNNKSQKIQYKRYLPSQYLLSSSIQQSRMIERFLKEEESSHNYQISSFYNLRVEPIVYNVSDMLRAKCMFWKVEDILQCANKLKQKISQMGQMGFLLLQIQNRLTKKCKKYNGDVVFKILVDGTVAELQLCNQFNVHHNEFNHKIYQISRSVFHSTFEMLQSMNKELKDDFLQDIWDRVTFINRKSTHEEQKLLYEVPEITFHKLTDQLQEFRKMVNFEPKISRQELENEQILRQQFTSLLRDGDYVNMAVDQQSIENNTRAYHSKKNQQIEKNQYKVYLTYRSQFVQKQQQHLRNIGAKALYQQQRQIQRLQRQRQRLQRQRLSKQEDNANPEESQEQNKIGKALLDQKRYAQALAQFQKCLASNIKGANNSQIIKSHFKIGLIHKQMGNYDQSQNSFQKCLQLGHQDGVDIDKKQILLEMHEIHKRKEQYSLALKNLVQYRNLINTEKNQQSIETAIADRLIGSVKRDARQYDAADQRFKQSLSILTKLKQSINNSQNSEESIRKYELQMGLTHKEMGNSLYQRKLFIKAYLSYKECLKLQKNNLGQLDLDLADTIQKLGKTYDSTQKYKEAQKLYKKCLIIYERARKKDSLEMAQTLHLMAISSENLSDFPAAIQNFEKSLKIKQEAKKKGAHISLAKTYIGLANTNFRQQKYIEAKEFYKKAFEEEGLKQTSIEYVAALQGMANIDLLSKRYKDAIEKYQKINRIENSKEQSIASAQLLCHYALALKEIGNKAQIEEAISRYREAKRIFTKFKQANCPQIKDIDTKVVELKKKLR